MGGVGEAPISFPNLMKELVFYYVYLFWGNIKRSVQVDILGSKKLLLFIEM
jgi:hypothetical protein